VWAGNPAKKIRELRPAEREYLRTLPVRYKEMASQHAAVMDLLRIKQEEYSG
jgi:carbonic anhydrase/acetyltransferase-like protein (isoleucine patch superfamily)